MIFHRESDLRFFGEDVFEIKSKKVNVRIKKCRVITLFHLILPEVFGARIEKI